MPYIVRDASERIVRASVKTLIGAEMVPYDHPELLDFLRKNGQEPSKVQAALAELRQTDADMSRAIEDVIMALLKKNLLKMTDLPKAVQDKMASRVKLRVMIQDIFDQASGQSSNASFASSNFVPTNPSGIDL